MRLYKGTGLLVCTESLGTAGTVSANSLCAPSADGKGEEIIVCDARCLAHALVIDCLFTICMFSLTSSVSCGADICAEIIRIHVEPTRGRYTHRAHRVVHRARTALTFLPTLSCIFHIFSGWQGRGGLRGKHTTTEAFTPSSSPMVVVAAHTPCQGRAVGRGRRGCRTLRYGRSTEEPSAPQGAQACGAVSNVSRFAVLNALVSRFGALLLGVPKPRK